MNKIIENDIIYKQGSLWTEIFDNKIITKPIRLIELFAGIGSQFKALKIIAPNMVEHWQICEWAYNSIIGYNAIHIKDKTDYSIGKSKEELISYLNGNISIDYDKPCNCSRKPIEWLRNAYNNCIATKNLINIMNVKGKDLEIVETDKYEYIMTYSFPCQDLSLAGKRKGMEISQASGGTRSGLLWEVERILIERTKENLPLPNVLLMENVPEVCGTNNLESFKKWINNLEKLGYQSYYKILNAKDYGIPQNRKRCFMVSILGDYSYEFPRKIKLKYLLENMEDKIVDKKYYLSDEQINKIIAWKTKHNPLDGIEKQKDICPTITTRGNDANYNMILIAEGLFKNNEVVDLNSSDAFKSNYDNEIAPTIITKSKFGICEILTDEEIRGGLPIMEATKKGYAIANVGDGIDISGRMKYHRGTVQKGLSQTIKTSNDIGVVVNEDVKVIGGIGTKKSNNGTQFYMQDRIYDDKIAPAITASINPYFKVGLKIRRLTPCESIKLMGFEKKDYQTLKEAGLSEGAIYHIAGDSIVVTNLVALFGELFKEDCHIKIVEGYIEGLINNG